jgi:hypothetical protein
LPKKDSPVHYGGGCHFVGFEGNQFVFVTVTKGYAACNAIVEADNMDRNAITCKNCLKFLNKWEASTEEVRKHLGRVPSTAELIG